MVTKNWDFAAPNTGHTLIDASSNARIPFYELNEKHTIAGNVETVTNTDSPALPVGGVLPGIGGGTHVDVSYEFVTYATWHFPDDTVYFLGQASWSVRYQGGIIRPGVDPVFGPGVDNRNNSSTSFTRSNANPAATAPPVANAGGAAWR